MGIEYFICNKSIRRNVQLGLATFAITCAALSPAGAENASDGRLNNASSIKPSGLHRVLAMPKTIAGFCAGVIVGMPVCFVRKLPGEINDGAHGLVSSLTDDDDHKLLLVPAAVLWLPAASLTSFASAPANAVKNAYKADKPFSKEQFSLGDWDEPITE